MRALNCNITPGFTPTMVKFFAWGAAQFIPITIHYDSLNPARCQLVFADSETATGGGLLYVWAKGAEECRVAQTIPPPGTQVEGASIELKAGTPPFPPGAKRAPWGPDVTCGSCPRPDSYDKILPFTPPGQSVHFMRANAWSVEFPPGVLPFVPEGSSEHPERLITAFLYKYPRALWPTIFAGYAAAGCTHWVLWWPNARQDGVSRAEFIDMCDAIKRAGFFRQIGLVSKDIDPRDQSPAEWRQYLDGDYSAFLAAGAAEEYAVWEWDLFNVPGAPTLDTLAHWGDLAHAVGASFWVHFRPGYTAWQADDRGEAGFWSDLGTHVDGLQFQGDPGWDIGDMQARLVDIYRLFASQGNRVTLRPFEWKAETQFTHDHPTECESDQLGYLALCTKGDATPGGYGFGARGPDGSYV